MSKQLRGWLRRTSIPDREKIAGKAGTSAAYLWQLAGGHRKASLEMAKRLEEATNHELTIQGLRPDIFDDFRAA